MPDFGHWGGINDRLAFGTYAAMRQYGHMLLSMSEYLQKTKMQKVGCCKSEPCRNLLVPVLDTNIRYTALIFCLLICLAVAVLSSEHELNLRPCTKEGFLYALSAKLRVRIFLFRMCFVRIRANEKASEVGRCRLPQ